MECKGAFENGGICKQGPDCKGEKETCFKGERSHITPPVSPSKSSDLLSIVLGGSVKITPAMVKWCREVNGGARIVKCNVVTYFGPRGFTYVMGMKLEEAGLLDFKKREPAVLTDAGRALCA